MDPRFGEMLDTSPEERARYYAMISRQSLAQRAAKVVGLCRATREFARAGIRRSCPDASALEVEIELVSRLYGPATARRLAPHLSLPRD